MADDPRDREVLAYYPYVVMRIGCTKCVRKGAYRLARLAAKFGAEAAAPGVLARLSADCPFRTGHVYHGRCEARYIDLDGPQPPPDLPPAALRVISGGKAVDARQLLRAVKVMSKRARRP
jgi:hypothetical protein